MHMHNVIGILDMKDGPFDTGVMQLIPVSMAWVGNVIGSAKPSVTCCTRQMSPHAPYLAVLRCPRVPRLDYKSGKFVWAGCGVRIMSVWGYPARVVTWSALCLSCFAPFGRSSAFGVFPPTKKASAAMTIPPPPIYVDTEDR